MSNYGFYGTTTKHVRNNEEMFTEMNYVDDENIKARMREDIIENNLRLAHYVVGRRYGKNLESICKSLRLAPDDIFSHATFGLMKAVDTFDLDKGFKFATYAAMVVNNELGMFMRKAKKTFHDTSMDAELYQDDEGNGVTLSGLLHDETSSIDLIEENNFTIWFYDRFSNTLEGREKYILEMTFKEGMTQKQIANKLKLSQSYISRICKSLVQQASKLYRELEES